MLEQLQQLSQWEWLIVLFNVWGYTKTTQTAIPPINQPATQLATQPTTQPTNQLTTQSTTSTNYATNSSTS